MGINPWKARPSPMHIFWIQRHRYKCNKHFFTMATQPTIFLSIFWLRKMKFPSQFAKACIFKANYIFSWEKKKNCVEDFGSWYCRGHHEATAKILIWTFVSSAGFYKWLLEQNVIATKGQSMEQFFWRVVFSIHNTIIWSAWNKKLSDISLKSEAIIFDCLPFEMQLSEMSKESIERLCSY